MGRKTQQNSITSPELLAQVNPENQRLAEDFINYLKSIQRSETTISSYKSDLEIFFVWNLLKNGNKVFVKVSKRDLIAYQNWLITEHKNSPARVRRLKSTLSALSNYIEAVCDEEYPEFRSIIKNIPSPVNQAVREKTVLSDEQLDSLLTTLVEQKKYQQACAVALAMCSGSRKSEIPRFKVSYFNDANIMYGSLYKTSEKIKTKGRGNGKYIFRYVLVKQFQPYFDLWIQQRKELGIESDWLFVTKTDGKWDQMPESTLTSWTVAYTKLLGVDFYWHCLRHYFTTHLAKSGIPDDVITSIVGWESATMCKIYKDIDADDEIGKYFDMDGIKQVDMKVISEL